MQSLYGRPSNRTYTGHISWIEDMAHFWIETFQLEDWCVGRGEIDDLIGDRFGDLRQDTKTTPADPAGLDGLGHSDDRDRVRSTCSGARPRAPSLRGASCSSRAG